MTAPLILNQGELIKFVHDGGHDNRSDVVTAQPPIPIRNGGLAACSVCALGPLCHPPSAPASAASPVECRRRFGAGELLFAAGAPRASIFAIRAGFAKLRAPDSQGGRHIVRFLLPGDAIGLDGFDEGLHHADAVALGDCEVCVIPAYRAGILCDFSPGVGAHLRRLLAHEVRELQEHSASLAHLTASRRVARFLLDLSRRWSERGFAGHAFSLPMGRRDLGDHLGLTTETVSRILHEFRARGLIALPQGGVEIRDAEALRRHLLGTADP